MNLDEFRFPETSRRFQTSLCAKMRAPRSCSVSLLLATFIVVGLITSSGHCQSADLYSSAITDNLKSPDGRLELVSECAKAPEGSEFHRCSIFVKDLRSGAKRPFYEWDRPVGGSADLFWSPTSKAVILNDYMSNTSESVLLILEPRFKRVNLSEVVLDAHPPKLHPDDIHAYSGATWIDANTIQMKLTGHHDTPPTTGFTYTYIYEVKEHSSRLTKHVEDCDEAHDQC
ncbi:MAG TPA: hypothetical protein VIX59_19340 [Candidatus Binataceae bacterium]